MKKTVEKVGGVRTMDKGFLERDTVRVAEQLIGCHLIRKTTGGTIRMVITETEAYKGSEDPASHAYRGVTPRNHWMFEEVGRLYVYFIYGMHFCMNVIAHGPGEVGAVLIRAGKPVEGIELIRANRPKVSDHLLVNGPGKLARAMEIDMTFNGYNLLHDANTLLYLEMNKPLGTINQTPRIGIKKGTDLLWRFILSE
jgi:DNA-3-methyladenine glycosylase